MNNVAKPQNLNGRNCIKIVRYNVTFSQKNPEFVGRTMLQNVCSSIFQNYPIQCRIVQNWNFDNGVASTYATLNNMEEIKRQDILILIVVWLDAGSRHVKVG